MESEWDRERQECPQPPMQRIEQGEKKRFKLPHKRKKSEKMLGISSGWHLHIIL